MEKKSQNKTGNFVKVQDCFVTRISSKEEWKAIQHEIINVFCLYTYKLTVLRTHFWQKIKVYKKEWSQIVGLTAIKYQYIVLKKCIFNDENQQIIIDELSVSC